MTSDRTERKIDISEETITRHCDAHGDYEVHGLDFGDGEVRYMGGCPGCVEARKLEDLERHEQGEKMRRAAELRSRLARAQIPERYADKRLGNYQATTQEQKRVLTVCQRFAETDKQGTSMVFCGPPGTGKTHLACGLVREWVERGRTALYTTVLKSIRAIKATYHRDSETTESEVIRRLIDLDLLVLDEVGAQLGSEHEMLLLFELINERYANLKSTILVGNLSHDELTEYLGERMMDRFREGGAVLALDWESWRGKRM